ncbi:MAG TPA: hypothetical protein VG735_13240 [Caulobacterales bacterium]|nr:hypothetical protein [Caulobacterales bacterium]
MSLNYELQPIRAIPAGIAGALVGGTLSSFIGIALRVMDFGGISSDEWALLRIQALPIVIIFSLAFLVGEIFLGVPGWIVLHRAGRRQWFDAMALGTFLAAIVYFTLSYLPLVFHSPGSDYSSEDGGVPTVEHWKLTAQGWKFLIEGVLTQSIAGGFAGLAVWRIAYRRK